MKPPEFEHTNFHDEARFSNAQFNGEATFWSTQFHGWTYFGGGQFHRGGNFRYAGFQERVSFENAKFHGASWFSGAAFKASTSFRDAAFGTKRAPSDADFTGIKVERDFDMTRVEFVKVPVFRQADFKQAPDLDNVKFALPDFWRGHEADSIATYRAIRRMAMQAADYEREQMAFKGEIRSKRGTEHKWYHAAFLYGLAYDALSDFGRSMSRPSLVWMISIVLFSLLYLASSGKFGNAFEQCITVGAPNYESALIISWKNVLPFIGIDSKTEEAARACLYGSVAYGGIAIQGLQKVLSAVLLFLFLLAVRNQFKIK